MATDPGKKTKKKKYIYERPHRVTKAEKFIYFLDNWILTILFLYAFYRMIKAIVQSF